MHAASMAVGASGAYAFLFGAVVIWSTTAINAHDGASPNALAGIRTRRTTASDRAWVAAHRAALAWAKGVSVFCALVGIASVVMPFLVEGGAEPHPGVLVVVGVGFAGTVIGCLGMTVVANRAAERAEREPR